METGDEFSGNCPGGIPGVFRCWLTSVHEGLFWFSPFFSSFCRNLSKQLFFILLQAISSLVELISWSTLKFITNQFDQANEVVDQAQFENFGISLTYFPLASSWLSPYFPARILSVLRFGGGTHRKKLFASPRYQCTAVLHHYLCVNPTTWRRRLRLFERLCL